MTSVKMAENEINQADTSDLNTALIASKNGSLDLGSGVYVWTGQTVQFDTMTDVDSVLVLGKGAIISQAAGTIVNRWSRMVSLTWDGSDVQSIHVEGLTFDHGGGDVTPPATAYEWEQAHCLSFYGGANTCERLTVRDVNTRDKIGGGIVLGSGHVKEALVENCHGHPDFPYGQGLRGCLEFQASVENLRVIGCSGQFVQSEPNSATPMGGATKLRASFTHCRFDTFDLIGYSGALDAQEYHLTHCHNGPDGAFWVRNGHIYATGGHYRQAVSTDWRNVQGCLDGATIQIPVVDGAFRSLNISAVSIEKVDVTFRDCRFTCDDAADEFTTGYAVKNGSAVATSVADKYRVAFDGVAFDPRFQGAVYAYRGGCHELTDCGLVSRSGSAAIVCGADASRGCDIVIDGCDLSGVSGDLVDVVASAGADWSLTFRGVMDYGKFGVRGIAPSTYEAHVVHEATWLSDARPSGDGLAGMVVKLRSPAFGEASEFICTTGSHTGAAVFAMTAQAGVAKGDTASRPTPHADDVGLRYLDTTLDADGLPIEWNGSDWVDGAGAVV